MRLHGNKLMLNGTPPEQHTPLCRQRTLFSSISTNLTSPLPMCSCPCVSLLAFFSTYKILSLFLFTIIYSRHHIFTFPIQERSYTFLRGRLRYAFSHWF